MDFVNPLKTLFGRNTPDTDVMLGYDPEKRVCETVAEAKENRYRQNETILLEELPIVRKEILSNIEDGMNFLGYNASIHLSNPRHLISHTAILKEKLWWKNQGMYLSVRALPLSSCLIFEAEEDPDGLLYEIEEKNKDEILH